MERTQVLETQLANVMIAELAGPTAPRPADSDDRFPLIEILCDSAFDGASTLKFQARVFDADNTIPHDLYSQPYERVELAAEELPIRRPRNRPRTIPRAMLATRSAPYERIEIEHETVQTIRPTLSATFEAQWYAEEIVDTEVAPEKTPRWMLIGAGALAAVTTAIVLLAAL